MQHVLFLFNESIKIENPDKIWMEDDQIEATVSITELVQHEADVKKAKRRRKVGDITIYELATCNNTVSVLYLYFCFVFIRSERRSARQRGAC